MMNNVVYIIPVIEKDAALLYGFLQERVVMSGIRYIVKSNFPIKNRLQAEDVQYIYKEDTSIYHAWRQALSMADIEYDDYVSFLGVTDRVSSGFVTTVTANKKLNHCLIYGNRANQNFKNKTKLQILCDKRPWFDVQHPGLLLKRRHLNDFIKHQPVTTAAQDLEIFIRLNRVRKLSCFHVDELQCTMGINGVSYSKSFLRSYLKDWIKIYTEYGLFVKIPPVVLLKVLVRSI
jgi:hypothetical protein